MCVLRAHGTGFDVDEFMKLSTLTPYQIDRKGERCLPRSTRNTRRFETSGLRIEVSDKDWDDLPGQIDDAISFLKRHADELRRLVSFPGVEDVRLDFPHLLRIGHRDVVVQFDYLPPALLRAAGNLGIGIKLSLYPRGAEDGEPPSPSPQKHG